MRKPLYLALAIESDKIYTLLEKGIELDLLGRYEAIIVYQCDDIMRINEKISNSYGVTRIRFHCTTIADIISKCVKFTAWND